MRYLNLSLMLFLVVKTAMAGFSMSTVSGELAAVGSADEGFKLKLSGRTILELEEPYVVLENLYRFDEGDVVLVHADAGGRMTSSYYLIVLADDKEPVISGSFSSQYGEEVYPVVRDGKIEIDLGYHGSIHEVMEYENGEVNMFVVPDKPGVVADENDCRFLYDDVYVLYIKGNDCHGVHPEGVRGMATERPYNALLADPRLDLGEFQKIAKESCIKKMKITYNEFQNKICGH